MKRLGTNRQSRQNEEQLKLVKPVLDDSDLHIHVQVDENNPSRFSDHSELLNYLRSRLLPACDGKPRGYCFEITLDSDKGAGRCILSTLLQMPQINCVRIDFFDVDRTKLPVVEISNFLHRKCSSQQERELFFELLPIKKPDGNDHSP